MKDRYSREKSYEQWCRENGLDPNNEDTKLMFEKTLEGEKYCVKDFVDDSKRDAFVYFGINENEYECKIVGNFSENDLLYIIADLITIYFRNKIDEETAPIIINEETYIPFLMSMALYKELIEGKDITETLEHIRRTHAEALRPKGEIQ